jgi:hypothetical protein
MLPNFMKLLLDENLPKKLKLDFTEYEIYTVTDKGWNGIKNGELLKLMLAENFDALLTFDKNLQHQQNFEKYPIAVFVYSIFINSYSELTKHSSKVKAHLASGNMPKEPIVISAI